MNANQITAMGNATGAAVRGVVHASGVETEFLRTGRGDVVILVGDDLDADDVTRTVDRLSRDFLVVATAPALHGAAELSRWLRDFLECLGVSNVHVIVHRSASAILTGGSIDA